MTQHPDPPPQAAERAYTEVRRRPGENVPTPRESHTAEDVRQGEIILRSRRRRLIFLGGLVACVLLALILSFL